MKVPVTELRALVQRALQSAGYLVQAAKNGAEAVALAAEHHPQVVILDIQMPVMDGFTTVKELRKQGYKTPINALTANALQGDRERCLNEGFNEHISKPINRQALIEVIFHYCYKDKF